MFPLFGKKTAIVPKTSLQTPPEINYETVCFLVRITKYTIQKLYQEHAESSNALDQILEDDNLEDQEGNNKEKIHLGSFIDETQIKDLVDGALSQNTPKKVLIEIIDLIRIWMEANQFLSSSEAIADHFKKIMIETFINGKDHEVRVKTVQIIQMFLSQWKGYFRKFCEIFKTTDSEAIRRSILQLLIEYATTVDTAVSLTVFELICMLIRSINHDERYFATDCLTKLKHIREEVIEKMFVRQMFARPKADIDEKAAIKKKKRKLIYIFENCTFEEEPYTGVFFAISQDEKCEIRLKAIDALKYFSSKYPSIQDKAQNILMNMLNDEIDEVRIASLKCMAVFDNTLILDQNSVNIVIFNLKEHNSELRHTIYSFFGHIKVDKWSTCKILMDHLLLNIKKFKQDIYGIFKTFKRLGSNHDEIVYNNLDKILGHNLKFKRNEPLWYNEEHTAKMIMI